MSTKLLSMLCVCASLVTWCGMAGVARAQSADKPSAAAALHLVSPNDVVDVKVFQEDDLATTARVSQDGTIKFPLIGSVKIGGNTAESAAQIITAALAKKYLVNPQVTVQVSEYAKRRFTVLGQVGKPGTYEIPDRDTITLLEAIGMAEGFTRLADLTNIRVKRMVEGKETLYKLNAKGLTDVQHTTAFEVKPGDVISVGESFL